MHLTLRLLQNLTLQTLVSILNSTKSSDIPTVIKSLSQESQDTLMKYLYKGMGMPGWGDVSGSVLLGWHEKASLRDCCPNVLNLCSE
jgi:actin related protein 2/3 complex subunit 5